MPAPETYVDNDRFMTYKQVTAQHPELDIAFAARSLDHPQVHPAALVRLSYLKAEHLMKNFPPTGKTQGKTLFSIAQRRPTMQFLTKDLLTTLLLMTGTFTKEIAEQIQSDPAFALENLTWPYKTMGWKYDIRWNENFDLRFIMGGRTLFIRTRNSKNRAHTLALLTIAMNSIPLKQNTNRWQFNADFRNYHDQEKDT